MGSAFAGPTGFGGYAGFVAAAANAPGGNNPAKRLNQAWLRCVAGPPQDGC